MPFCRITTDGIPIKLFSLVVSIILFLHGEYLLSPSTVGASPLKDNSLDQELAYLQQEAQAIDMMITAGKRPERITDIPASVVVITRKEIETQGYTCLSEILANVPGLHTVDIHSTGGKFYGLRGVSGDTLLMLVNGINQVGDVETDYYLSRIPIPVEAIDRIEVVRGPLSVMYGAGAFLGVINIITNEVSATRKNSMISVSQGSHGTRKAFVRTSGKKRGWSYTLSGSTDKSDGIDQPLTAWVNDPETLDNWQIPRDARTQDHFKARHNYMNFSAKNDFIGLDFSYSDTKKGGYFLIPALDGGTHGRFRSLMASFSHRASPIKDLHIESRLTYSHELTQLAFQLLDETNKDEQKQASQALETEINFYFTPTSFLNFSTGIYNRTIFDAYNQYHVPSMQTFHYRDWLDDGDEISTSALFVQSRYSPVDALNFIAGIRFEKLSSYRLRGERNTGSPEYESVSGVYDKNSMAYLPRLAAIYAFNPRHTLKMIYSTAIRRPSFWSNSKVTLDNSIDHDNLSPEHITAYEINYCAQVSRQLKSNISIFRNQMKDIISNRQTLVDQGTYVQQMLNVDEFNTDGIEFTLTSQISPILKAELSTIFQRTRLKQYPSLKPCYSPDILGYFKLSYTPLRDISMGLTLTYTGKTYADFSSVTLNPDGSTTFGKRLADPVPSYFNMGLNLRIENIFKKGLFANLKISNPCDWKIRCPGLESWSNKGILDDGRQVLISMGYKF